MTDDTSNQPKEDEDLGPQNNRQWVKHRQSDKRRESPLDRLRFAWLRWRWRRTGVCPMATPMEERCVVCGSWTCEEPMPRRHAIETRRGA